MNIQELYNLITMLPEAALEYMSTRLLPPNELAKDEKTLLTKWVSKGHKKIIHDDINKAILLMISNENIQYIANPSEEESLKAVYENPNYITHIDEPSENVQMAAINNNKGVAVGRIFNMIKNPSRLVWLAIIEETPGTIATMNDPDEEYQLAAIKAKPDLIRNSSVNWSVNARRLAFRSDPSYFAQLADPTIDECWDALKHNSKNITFIKDPSDEMKAYSILVA